MKVSRIVLSVTGLVVAFAVESAFCHEADGAAHTSAAVVQRRAVEYVVPAVEVVREDGKAVNFADELNREGPVVVNFVFTSCDTICPLSSRTFSALQGRLGAQQARVRLVSVSIDPEQDTPARLAAYAAKYRAGPAWHHYTGTVAAIQSIQRAFDAYRGRKMEHAPVTFVRTAASASWIRLDGFTTAEALMNELRPALAGR
ncbi:MAG: SCO family protein [Gammaproteobacteria bacterium]|nr:SCO family protein [Gammaproteobacteria bacterium]